MKSDRYVTLSRGYVRPYAGNVTRGKSYVLSEVLLMALHRLLVSKFSTNFHKVNNISVK
jgi:hypothetical protein